jgi:hypothetical protein
MNECLTAKEVAKLLDLSLEDGTIENWLKGGHFPGAFIHQDGNWLYPKQEVENFKSAMEALKFRNHTRDLSLSDSEKELKPPLL